MRIGFDAKRFFHNTRGLGNYSRDAVRVLSSFYPDNQYILFNPKPRHRISVDLPPNVTEVTPTSFFGKKIPSLWRSRGMCRDMDTRKIDIFHGLSQELPWGIERTNAKSVVTFHDAIFIRYPELYATSYRKIFTLKNRYACRVADRIIAISEQSKRDAIEFFNADEKKISVVYQGCNAIFRKKTSQEEIMAVRNTYHLPKSFLLNVGAIEKRKNAKLIVEALYRQSLDISLVVVGAPTDYLDEVRETVHRYGMENQVVFLHHVSTADLPALYAASEAFVYPSVFEGFGIPVLEALCVGTPVITSRGSCFEETAGNAALYIDPYNADELGEAIHRVLTDEDCRQRMIAEGKRHAENFTDYRIADELMKVYKSLNGI